MCYSKAELWVDATDTRCYGDDEFRECGKERRWRAAEKKKSRMTTGCFIDGSRSREGNT
jgi:hypothetical protein